MIPSREKGGGLRGLLLLSFPLFLLPALAARPADEPWTVLLSGDADGYLAPCGCTSPMQGGLKRRTAALRQGGERKVVLDNGGLAGGLDAQHRIKGQMAARALRLAEVDAANFGGQDARLGAGEALSLNRLSGGRLVSTSLRPSATVPVEPWREAGPFLVGGATRWTSPMAEGLRESVVTPREAARRLIEEAEVRSLAPVLLFDGDRAAAAALARAEPSLRLVTYRATGRPPASLVREGECALATPGERGKSVIRLSWQGGGFVSASVETLGPEVRDDPAATELYREYLARVSSARLLEAVPREPGKAFAGTARCGSCHASAAKVWRASEHAHGLKTLEREGHDRDPDCVGCHVVGLDKTTGFRSRKATPQLAEVGCESCHGAGAAHAARPRLVRMPKVGRAACAPCHTLENSPHFDFSTYWPKVKH